MAAGESEATCNFTPSADGFRDYFARERKQMDKVRIELFWHNDLTESPISAREKKTLPRSLIHQTACKLISLNDILVVIKAV